MIFPQKVPLTLHMVGDRSRLNSGRKLLYLLTSIHGGGSYNEPVAELSAAWAFCMASELLEALLRIPWLGFFTALPRSAGVFAYHDRHKPQDRWGDHRSHPIHGATGLASLHPNLLWCSPIQRHRGPSCWGRFQGQV